MKIFVCGNVDGQFNRLFDRIRTIQAKSGQFDLLLCVGDFFATDHTWGGFDTKKVDIDTFIIGSEMPPNHDQDSKIKFVHKSDVVVHSSGLVIAYKERTTEVPSEDVDILVTPDWPRGVLKALSDSPTVEIHGEDVNVESGSSDAARAALRLKPRYHFTASKPIFYERTPFRTTTSRGIDILSRFIALANVGNKSHKWLYAFSIKPSPNSSAEELFPRVRHTTNPYIFSQQEKPERAPPPPNPDTLADSSQFFFAPTDIQTAKKRRNDSSFERPSDDCWFCLGSESVERHLIVGVAEHCYLAMAKGFIDPLHVLILPISHVESSVCLDSDSAGDVDRYKLGLERFYLSRGLVFVAFERNFHSRHLQIQVLGIPGDLVSQLKDILYDQSRALGLRISKLGPEVSLSEVAGPGRPYFCMEIGGSRFFMSLVNVRNFPMNFGREIVCHVVGCPERTDWRACVVGDVQEKSTADHFRELFSPHDLTE